MKITSIAFGILCLLTAAATSADSLTESAQRILKEQGFYYGEATGQKDADTTAAIRRYQIRNGLKITGEINAETQKSLGLQGSAPIAQATPTPPPRRPTPPPVQQRSSPDENSEPRDEPPDASAPAQPATPNPAMRYALAGTPYETAAPEMQQRVIVGAQAFLARHGYYRSEIDGIYGAGMQFALRAYQTRFGLNVTGRLDRETLAVLGLLPGQRAPGLTAPRRYWRRPATFTPSGEPVYVPR